MKHSSTRMLYDYWNERRKQRAAPERGDIEPSMIRAALGDTFILAFDATADHPFRLAGTRVCALFGRELKGEPFAGIWHATHRQDLVDLIGIVADEQVGAVAGASGRTSEGFTTDLELLLLPLRHHGKTHARMIGALAPTVAPFWLGVSRIDRLSLGTVRHIRPALERGAPPHITPPPRPAPARPNLVLHQGGRS